MESGLWSVIAKEIANMKKKPSYQKDESIVLDGQEEAALQSSEVIDHAEDEGEKPNVVAQAVYKTVYAVSFGVVFSSLLFARLVIPKNSLVAKGLHDGSVAAQKAVEEKEPLFAEVAEQTAEFLSGEEPASVPL